MVGQGTRVRVTTGDNVLDHDRVGRGTIAAPEFRTSAEVAAKKSVPLALTLEYMSEGAIPG